MMLFSLKPCSAVHFLCPSTWSVLRSAVLWGCCYQPLCPLSMLEKKCNSRHPLPHQGGAPELWTALLKGVRWYRPAAPHCCCSLFPELPRCAFLCFLWFSCLGTPSILVFNCKVCHEYFLVNYKAIKIMSHLLLDLLPDFNNIMNDHYLK